MRGTSPISSSAKVGVLLTLLAGLSLLLNVFLEAHLLNRRPVAPAAVKSTDNFRPDRLQPSSVVPATSETPDAAEAESPTFHWSEVESTDYRQYIAHLRALGIPEQVVRDIIVADVNQIYTKRAREIWQPPANKYWQKYSNERPNSKQLEQLSTLGKAHGALLQELLGARIGRQELIDTLYLQVQGSERQLLFLPPEKRAAALAALADADFESKEMQLHAQGSYRSEDEQKLFNEKLALLAPVLSPEELEEFHRRNSPSGSMLKSEVRYLNLTPEEYQQLLLAKEASGGEQSTKETLRKLFGDERAKEFELVGSSFYINDRTGAEAEGIPLDRVEQAAKFAASLARGEPNRGQIALTVLANKVRELV